MGRVDSRDRRTGRARDAIADETRPGGPARALPRGPALAYAGALAVFAVWGLYGVTVKALIAGLFLVAAATRRLDRFVRDWCVFLAGVALFDSLRAAVFVAVGALELPFHMGYVIRLERALFAGETLPTRAQAVLLRAEAAGPLARLLVAVHASHFVVFLLFGLGLWLVRREAFPRFAAAMLLVMGLGLVGYLVMPTVPPWMAASLGAIPPIRRVADQVYGQAIPGLRRALDTNPIAAMPSLHAGFAAICALVAFHELGAWGWALAAYLGLASLAAVALGEHYFLDLVAGWLVAAGAYWLLYRSAFAARLDGRRRRAPGGRAAPPATGWRDAAGPRLLAAAALLLLATAVSQLSLRAHRPFALTERFVRRELGGRAGIELVCPRC